MNILILTTFMVQLVSVLSDSREDELFKALCSESYFDRLKSTTPLDPKREQQVFHLYRSLRVPNQGYHYNWNVTVNRSGLNNTLKAVSIESKLEMGELPGYQLRLYYTVAKGRVKSQDLPSLQNVSNEWCTAYGFNALDENNYFLCENLTHYLMKVKDRSQYFGKFKRFNSSDGKTFYFDTDPSFGFIPVFEFLGIDCSKQEVTTEEEGDDDPFWFFSSLSDEFFYIYAAVALIFAFVLPIPILWILDGRYRFTQEIYDDSRLGSQSEGRSATHESVENAPADLRGVRRVRVSQLRANLNA